MARDEGSLRSESKYNIVYEASDQSMGNMVVAMASLALLTGAFYYVGAIALVCVYQVLVHQSLLAATVLAVMVASSYYKTQILWQELIDHWVWQTWCEYFSFKVVNEAEGEFDKDKNYIFGEFPHGPPRVLPSISLSLPYSSFSPLFTPPPLSLWTHLTLS